MESKGSAIWKGGLKEGKGSMSTASKTLNQSQYSVNSRFAKSSDTNPEELLAAAHAGCFNMALASELGKKGITPEKLETSATVTLSQVGDGYEVTESHLELAADIPNVDQAKFDAAVKAAKEQCVVSKLFNTNITVSARLKQRA